MRGLTLVIFCTFLALAAAPCARAQEESEEERYRPEDGWVVEPDTSEDKDLSDEELIQKYVREGDTDGGEGQGEGQGEGESEGEGDGQGEGAGSGEGQEEGQGEGSTAVVPEVTPEPEVAPGPEVTPEPRPEATPEPRRRAETPPSPPAKDVQKWPGTLVKGRKVHEAIEALIARESAVRGGFFLFHDETSKKVLKLTHEKVHDAVTRIQGRAEREIIKRATDRKILESAERDGARVLFSRNEFETDSTARVTLDFWFVEVGTRLRIADIQVHDDGSGPRHVFVADRPYPTVPD